MFLTLAEVSNLNENDNQGIRTTGDLTITTSSKKHGKELVTKEINVRVSVVNGKPVLEMQHEDKAMKLIQTESKICKLKRSAIEDILSHFVGSCTLFMIT